MRPRSRRLSGRTAVALVALTVVTTAAAPAVITIAPGDTLWGLAREHGTTVSELQRLNGLDGSGTIYAGRTLKVPGAAGAAGAAAAVSRGFTAAAVLALGFAVVAARRMPAAPVEATGAGPHLH